MLINSPIKTGRNHSKLSPYTDKILAMRKRGKTLRKIQSYLAKRKDMQVSLDSINSFIKCRQKISTPTEGKKIIHRQTSVRKSPSKLSKYAHAIMEMYLVKRATITAIQDFLESNNVKTSRSNLYGFIARNKEKASCKSGKVSIKTTPVTTNHIPSSVDVPLEIKYAVKDDWRKYVSKEEYSDIIYIAMFKVLSGDEGNALKSYVTSVHGLNHPNPTDENWDEGLEFIDDLRLNKYGIESLWIKTMLLANRKDLLKRI